VTAAHADALDTIHEAIVYHPSVLSAVRARLRTDSVTADAARRQ
jgi:hypothetical protein